MMEYSTEILVVAGLAIIAMALLILFSFLEEKDRKYATENTHYRLMHDIGKQTYIVQILVYSNSDGAYWMNILSTMSDTKKIPEEMLQEFLTKPNTVRDADKTC